MKMVLARMGWATGCLLGLAGAPRAQELPSADGGPMAMVVLHSEGEPVARRVFFSRVPPTVVHEPSQEPEDETFQVVVGAAPSELPSQVDLVSQGAAGHLVDMLRGAQVSSAACPSALAKTNPSWACASTEPLRLVSDLIDRNHASSAGRTLVGEVGGMVSVHAQGRRLGSVEVAGPPGVGEPWRFRVKLRVRVLRSYPGGPPAVGGDDEGAKALLRAQVAAASALFGQCGVHLGPPEALDVAVVDPPSATLLEVGCGAGLPASGGQIELLLDGKHVRFPTHAGEHPIAAAGALAVVLRSRGLVVDVHRNPVDLGAGLPSADLVIRRRDGRPAHLSFPLYKPSSDPTLPVCRGVVDFGDGLEHFTDTNSAMGTLEERSLLRPLLDSDPSTIDVLVVPVFAGIGRIGESFIYGPGASIQNALILDRAGVRAGARSLTFAHELGHILLDMPGHPDDFGVDAPTSLMDADASDPTIFGPRRLSLADCVRALRQSGPDSPVPLIEPWPISDGEESTAVQHQPPQTSGTGRQKPVLHDWDQQ